MKRSEFLITAVPTATVARALPAEGSVAQPADDALPAYGVPPPYEHAVSRRPARSPNLALTPLDRQLTTITPSGLAFVRNHAGVPTIDPQRHRILVHGLVTRALSFSIADLMRFPAVERAHFIECAGNSARGWQRLGSGVQFSHGLLQSARWTGVQLKTLLHEAGVAADARWVIAEGADDAHFDRSLPLAYVLENALLAYGQNGEMLRPEQGYPVRLIVPGYEGSTNVKWLRRLKLSAKPVYSREETAQYSETLPDGKIHLFEFAMGVKSVIVDPAPDRRLGEHGAYEGRGFAWGGSGRMRSVDVSLDDGGTWTPAALDPQTDAHELVRFRFPLRWAGAPMVLVSRATDDQGSVQPTLAELISARGANLRYHVNARARWGITRDGLVSNLDA